MGVLHLVNRSPGESLCLRQCFARVGNGDAVLLLEGGVYGALSKSALAPQLAEALERVSIYVLTPDLQARGLGEEEVLAGVSPIGYTEFVQLCLIHSPVQSWF